MKYLIIPISMILLSACQTTKEIEYSKSICSVDRNGFVYSAENKSNKQHTLSISSSRIYYKSATSGEFTDDLEVSNSFIYTGSKENGLFSYLSVSTKEPLILGHIDYLCWSGLKTKYKSKVSFNEKITRN